MHCSMTIPAQCLKVIKVQGDAGIVDVASVYWFFMVCHYGCFDYAVLCTPLAEPSGFSDAEVSYLLPLFALVECFGVGLHGVVPV